MTTPTLESIIARAAHSYVDGPNCGWYDDRKGKRCGEPPDGKHHIQYGPHREIGWMHEFEPEQIHDPNCACKQLDAYAAAERERVAGLQKYVAYMLGPCTCGGGCLICSTRKVDGRAFAALLDGKGGQHEPELELDIRTLTIVKALVANMVIQFNFSKQDLAEREGAAKMRDAILGRIRVLERDGKGGQRELDEVGWLIERRTPETEYLVAWSGGFEWTKESLKAIRFCRREDANQVAEIFEGEDVHICEHMWSASGKGSTEGSE